MNGLYEYEAETIPYHGITIKVVADNEPSDPRKAFENVGHMVCFHRRYDLGDPTDLSGPQEAMEYASKVADEGGVVLPLFLYDHSGITMNTTGFADRWDSGQVGIIYATAEDIKREWNGDTEAATRYLRGEVKVYDDYLTGNVWGWVIEDADGNHLESVWGYYGDYQENGCLDDARESARSEVRMLIKKERERRAYMASLATPYGGVGIPA